MVTLIKILSPVIIIIGISSCLGSQYYNPAGLRSKSAKFIIVGASANLVLNLILIPKFWSKGAASATIIAELIITILYLKYCNKFYTFKQLINMGWKKLVAGIIMFISISFINLLQISNVTIIVLQMITGILIYITTLFAFKDQFILETSKQIIKKVEKN